VSTHGYDHSDDRFRNCDDAGDHGRSVVSKTGCNLSVTPASASLIVGTTRQLTAVTRDDAEYAVPRPDREGEVWWGARPVEHGVHPQYAANRFFYVFFTGLQDEIRIERYTTTSDPIVADPASGKLIFTTPHSDFSNHNGCLVAFGPDGMFYPAFGDGGSSGDH
jgi:hypothetical protein